jgi:dephospho-CoA kinase
VLLIGLTGGIGSGKSTVSAALARRGATVVDADAVVRDLQQPGTPVFRAIVERFGPGVVAADGALDRPALAAVVFNDEAARAALNAIVHPPVGVEIQRRVAEAAGGDGVVILDVPLLGEASRRQVAAVLVVDCPVETAVARLVGSRGMAEADARARIAAQIPRSERLALADFVVDNSGPPEALEAEVERAWAWIEGLRAGARRGGPGAGETVVPPR